MEIGQTLCAFLWVVATCLVATWLWDSSLTYKLRKVDGGTRQEGIEVEVVALPGEGSSVASPSEASGRPISKQSAAADPPRMFLLWAYYGPLPFFFDVTVESVRANQGVVEVLLFTDQPVKDPPPNLHIVPSSIEDMRRRLYEFLLRNGKTGIDEADLLTVIDKMRDLKVVHRYVFEPEFSRLLAPKGNDYVGFGELDTILGDVRMALSGRLNGSSTKLSDVDVLGLHGHLWVLRWNLTLWDELPKQRWLLDILAERRPHIMDEGHFRCWILGMAGLPHKTPTIDKRGWWCGVPKGPYPVGKHFSVTTSHPLDLRLKADAGGFGWHKNEPLLPTVEWDHRSVIAVEKDGNRSQYIYGHRFIKQVPCRSDGASCSAPGARPWCAYFQPQSGCVDCTPGCSFSASANLSAPTPCWAAMTVGVSKCKEKKRARRR